MPSSYKPICLINAMGKVYATLRDRLITELEEKGALCEQQYGFRKKKLNGPSNGKSKTNRNGI